MSDRGHGSPTAPAETGAAENTAADELTTGDERFDFGVRNTLLYFKDLKQATLDLSPGSGAVRGAVDRLLASHRVSLSELFDNEPNALRDATKRVRAISYRAQRSVDKGAQAALGIAWGMATWDNGRSTTPAAPVVLREAGVARRVGTDEDFYLAVEGGWILNTSLLHLLEMDFGVDVELGALVDLVEELADHGDPDALFERVAKIAHDVPGFAVARRVVLGSVPRAPMLAGRDIAAPAPARGNDVVAPDATPAGEPDATPSAYPDAAPSVEPEGVASVEPGEDESEDDVLARTVELFRTGMLNPARLAPGSTERLVLEEFGTDAVIAEITATLRGDSWPEALVEHADSGLRVRDPADLLQRWFDASGQRPRPSQWDATHFALWGLAAAPAAGKPAIGSVARWGEKRHHPVLLAWQLVAERRNRGHHSRRRRKLLPARGVAIPRGLDQALWGLPVDLLAEWAAWVFRQWPGAPIELLLPTGTGELVSSWYERARPVAELAVKTWIPFAAVERDLGRSARRWVKHLTVACDGGGAPLATWFEQSTDAAAQALALRLGDPAVTGGRRGRRSKRRPAAPAEHAI
ncbi:MAG TPA: hypothetical protein VN799_01970 [Acidimicrobiales bacterium]|nr:hypothetical protein [Acidimicrobiales bacterium]